MSKKRTKRKFSAKKLFKGLLIIFLTFVLLGFIAGGAFVVYIVSTTEKFDPDKLDVTESSRIFFNDGELIGTVSTEKREKVTYDNISEVLIDAIVATEDSRFFQHNGFNGARFFKATVQQLLHHSGGGASTITMQVSKNNYTDTVNEGIQGIIRKFRDIYISVFQIEKNYTKEEILEFYVNYPFLGSQTHGIEQACQTYFGKSADEVSLPEAALIAGLFQAPGAYDPYINPEAAEARRTTVLDLMVRHGYITEEEADIANSIPVKQLLVKDYSTEVSEYQVLLDTVITDIRNEYGVDPYQVSMDIYTTFDKKNQDAINKFYETYNFLDNKVQVGIALINNKDGSVSAVGGGRNKTREFSYNYATQTWRHIGSTAKPLFDYGPAIEYMNWSTYTPLLDEKVTYTSGIVMNNWDMKFEGLLTAKAALSESRNTTALQTFQILDNKKVKKFVLSVGLTPEIDAYGGLHEAHAVGAFSGTSPLQLAGAYSSFARGGYYTEPYTYTKLVFRESGRVVEPEIEKTKVMKDSTAYMITWMLLGVTPANNVTGTQIATKTGTSSYDTDTLKAKGLSTTLIQDSWVATYSPDYTMTFWYGYDELMEKYNMTMNVGSVERGKIQKILLNSIFKKNSTFKKPSSVITSSVELETFPPKIPSANTPSKMKETHLFVKGTQPTEISRRFTSLKDPENLSVNVSGNTVDVSWDAASEYAKDNNEMKQYLNEYYGKLADRYYERLTNYNSKKLGKFGYNVYLDDSLVGFTTKTHYSFEANGGSSVTVKTAYSKFQKNTSDGVTEYIDIHDPVVPTPDPGNGGEGGNGGDNGGGGGNSVTCSLEWLPGENSVINANTTYSEAAFPLVLVCGGSEVEATLSKEDSTSTMYSGDDIISYAPTETNTYTITYYASYGGHNYSKSRTITVTVPTE